MKPTFPANWSHLLVARHAVWRCVGIQDCNENMVSLVAIFLARGLIVGLEKHGKAITVRTWEVK